MSGGSPAKKRRGRPRMEVPVQCRSGLNPAAGGSSSGAPVVGSAASQPSAKKRRGRPVGCGGKPCSQESGSVRSEFTPHMISVKAGEDAASKIYTFASRQPAGVLCILSGFGAISEVTFSQSSLSDGVKSLKERCDVAALKGSFHLVGKSGKQTPGGGISVILSNGEGVNLSGTVAVL